jgi:hypothetical protein
MQKYAYGDHRMHMGNTVRIRAGTGNNSHMGSPSTHNEIVPIRGLTYMPTGRRGMEVDITMGMAPELDDDNSLE